MKQIVCDRCEAREKSRDGLEMLSGWSTAQVGGKHYDLCKKCVTSFERYWMHPTQAAEVAS